MDGFSLVEAVFPLLFLGMLGLIVFTGRRNWNRAKQAGLDPVTMQTDLAIRAMKSQALSPAAGASRTPAERLAELDQLLADRTITAAEHAEARRAIIADV